jgi:Cytochrome P460
MFRCMVISRLAPTHLSVLGVAMPQPLCALLVSIFDADNEVCMPISLARIRLAVSAAIASGVIATPVFAQSLSGSKAQTGPCYPPKYTASGDLILPENFHEWVYVGSPLTPNALNKPEAHFPEFHNVYIEPCSYATYKKTNVFPEGTIFFKELQLTLPEQNPDGSRTEPSGRGYFLGPWNGADVTVKDSKRYADTGAWGYYNFNHREPKLQPLNCERRRNARIAI